MRETPCYMQMSKIFMIVFIFSIWPCQILAMNSSSMEKKVLSYSTDNVGKSIQKAARSGDKENVSVLLNRAGRNQDYLDLALQSAVLGGVPDTVKYLIASGANVNRLIGIYEPETSFQTALALSYMSSDIYVSMVKALIDGGADINGKYPSGLTPLGMIIKCEDPDIELIKYFISKGAIPTKLDVKYLKRCDKNDLSLINYINENLAKPIAPNKHRIITAESLSPNKQVKLTVNDNGAVVVKNLHTGETREISGSVEYGCGSAGCGDAAQLAVFSPEGKIAVTSSSFLGGPTIVWDVQTWTEKYKVDGGYFDMSPDGKWLASYMSSFKTGAVLFLTNLGSGKTMTLSAECCYEHMDDINPIYKINSDLGWFKGDYEFNFSMDSKSLIINTGSGEKEIIEINELPKL